MTTTERAEAELRHLEAKTVILDAEPTLDTDGRAR
jgi:hypothetical protein